MADREFDEAIFEKLKKLNDNINTKIDSPVSELITAIQKHSDLTEKIAKSFMAKLTAKNNTPLKSSEQTEEYIQKFSEANKKISKGLQSAISFISGNKDFSFDMDFIQKSIAIYNESIGNMQQEKIMKVNELFTGLQKTIGKTIAPIQNLAAQFVIDHWSQLQPIIEGVTVALTANKLAINAGMIITKLSKAWGDAVAALELLREGNNLAAVAQELFNGTMLACPTTWMIAGITALIVAGYYLIKNWDKVRVFLSNLWNNIKTIFSNALNYIWKLFDNKNIQAALLIFAPLIGFPVIIIKNWDKIRMFFNDLWNGIKAAFAGGVDWICNSIINVWNKLNTIFEAINSVFSKIFGIKDNQKIQIQSMSIITTPMMSKYASGTLFHPGGLAIVGEEGPEMVNLPRGSQVFSYSRTKSLLEEIGNGNLGISVNYSPRIIIQGNADAQVMKEASDRSYADFERNFNALLDRRRRLSFVGG